MYGKKSIIPCGRFSNLTSKFSLYTTMASKKCSSKKMKRSLFFESKTLLVYLFVNCSMSNYRGSVGNSPNGSTNVM
jgi:hypothetical protein